jgi:ergothioneine biosynthesis protein EgtB
MERAPASSRKALGARYQEIRSFTERLCAPLLIEDYGVQPVPEVSPPKWHLAHTTWFFERFLLTRHVPGYESFDPAFDFLFNSYYNSIGPHLDRARRGLQSRPGVTEIYRYRHSVDQAIEAMLGQSSERRLADIEPILTLGIHHEQQHQELLLTDIKHILWCNCLRPAYRSREAERMPSGLLRTAVPDQVLRFDSVLSTLGARGDEFCFDNERPAHRVYLEAFELSTRPVSCGQFLEFIEGGGYRDPSLWLSAGWEEVQRRGWEAPLYWEKQEGRWWVYTLDGFTRLNEDEPVCHISYYEADAFARWSGKRLPSEAEWEHAAGSNPGFHGDVWEWTASPYSPYPGFRPLPAELGEYNGKFMCNQYVLRGGSRATPAGHVRPTYRNFFPPESRWQFSGARLAA